MARIHHLNCATLCPHGARLVGQDGGLLAAGEIICHCLLIESADGLILVDTGFGTGDCANPKQLGQPFRTFMRPTCNRTETAIERIRGLGFDPADVRHIAVTHLDLDHAGGLPDFPAAKVHVFAPELAAASKPLLREWGRYIPAHIAHGPDWASYETGGDEWFGFESVRVLPDSGTEIALVPLVGHSRGHSAVAVRDGEGWLLHCGDAYFHHGEVETPNHCPPGLRLFQNVMAIDRKARLQNQERLRELARDHGDEVRLFCAHDPHELRRDASN